jgi:hypothetical protein
MAKLKFVKTPMPVYWASYLINGDASGLEPGEQQRVDAYLKHENIIDVADVADESYFSWSYDLYGGEAQGGDLVDYTVRYGR